MSEQEPKQSPLTHFDAQGRARMVDVSAKQEPFVRLQPEPWSKCRHPRLS